MTAGNPLSVPQTIVIFLLWWILATVGIIAAGVPLGIFVTATAHLAFQEVDLTLREIFLTGSKNGAFYGLVWAPGTAIVLAFIQTARARHKSKFNQP